MHALQWHSAWYNFQSRFISLVEHFSEEIDSALSKLKWGIRMLKRKLGVRQVWNWSTCGSQFCHSKQHVNMQRPPSNISKKVNCEFSGVSPMVQFAKSVALNIDDQAAVSGWRRQNQSVSENLQTSLLPTHQIPNPSTKSLSVKNQSWDACWAELPLW